MGNFSFLKSLRPCVSAVIFCSSFSFACQCPSVEPLTNTTYSKYDVIFYGIVDSTSICKERSTAYFTIYELYKGEADENTALSVDCTSDCAMNIQKGEKWIVYGTFHKYGEYEAEFCSRTRKQYEADSLDFNKVSLGNSFKEELYTLKKDLGLKQFKNFKDNSETLHHNPQPSPYQKIILVVIPLLLFGLFYFLSKKCFNKKQN